MSQTQTKDIALSESDIKLRASFEVACNSLINTSIVSIDNVLAAFDASQAIVSLRSLLTKEVMEKYFIPLMNSKIGFMTDRNGRPSKNGEVRPLYAIEVVKDCIIDAMSYGLLPTGNQFNIIADRMYPTKEGFTALLKKKHVKYQFTYGADQSKIDGRAEIPVKIDYSWNDDKKSYTFIANVKKDNYASYASYDQSKGKAERAAKKNLYEYITGIDFGEADIDAEYEDLSEKKPSAPVVDASKQSAIAAGQQPQQPQQPQQTQQQATQAKPQDAQTPPKANF